MSCSPASDVVTSLQSACRAGGVRPEDVQTVNQYRFNIIIMKSICPFFNLQLSYYDFRSTCFMKTQSESCFFLYSNALGTEQVVILSA